MMRVRLRHYQTAWGRLTVAFSQGRSVGVRLWAASPKATQAAPQRVAAPVLPPAEGSYWQLAGADGLLLTSGACPAAAAALLASAS